MTMSVDEVALKTEVKIKDTDIMRLKVELAEKSSSAEIGRISIHLKQNNIFRVFYERCRLAFTTGSRTTISKIIG